MRCQKSGKMLDDTVKVCPWCSADAVQYNDEPLRYSNDHSENIYDDEPLPLTHKPKQTHKGKGKLVASFVGIGVIAAAAITIPLILNKNKSASVDGLYELDGHYYKVFNNPDKMDFNDSKSACERMGGHLVSINSQTEQDLIEEITGDKDNYWIGLEQSGFDWKWVDSSEFEYTNWDMWVNANGEECWQPDNYENREDVARIAGNSVTYDEWKMNKGGWLDTNRYGEGEDLSTYGYVCEWDSKPDESKITEK